MGFGWVRVPTRGFKCQSEVQGFTSIQISCPFPVNMLNKQAHQRYLLPPLLNLFALGT